MSTKGSIKKPEESVTVLKPTSALSRDSYVTLAVPENSLRLNTKLIEDMYEETLKMMIEYKTSLFTLDEQMKTSHSKLREIVESTYKTITPRIKVAGEYLDMEVARARKESAKLQVQVEGLAKEEEEIEKLVDEYFRRTEVLQSTING
eukprot:TRINITY_DN2203_c0_g2_i4.p1 TRINITY_DN2203_c0_g2~~TRINITY_DN2203_c0_g2_i4.p1  ORF type:complete len:148 (+),score=60.64 TRINITY_DN2203_c0_g2_i4:144-587(+)